MDPMTLREAVALQGDAWVLAKEAMTKRARAEELIAEAHQLIADAEAIERAARALPAHPATTREET